MIEIENQLYSPLHRAKVKSLSGVSLLTVTKVNTVL